MNILLKELFWLIGALVLAIILRIWLGNNETKSNLNELFMGEMYGNGLSVTRYGMVIRFTQPMLTLFSILGFVIYLIRVTYFFFTSITINLIFCIIGILFLFFFILPTIHLLMESSGWVVYPPLSALPESLDEVDSNYFYKSIGWTLIFVSVLLSMGIGAILLHTIRLWKL